MSIANLYIDQGSDYSTTITINDSAGSPLDLSLHTATAQIRKTYTSSTSVSFIVTFDPDRTTGKITIALTNTQTSALKSGLYVYDVLISDVALKKTRVVEGTANVSPMVTQ
jgi:hypothetical protein